MCEIQLIEEIAHEDESVRMDAIKRLGIGDASDVARFLIDRFASPNADARNAARQALVRLGDKDTV